MSVSTPDQPRQCVLVVVEDPIAGELIERMLHLAGFSTVLAPTGEQALLQLRAHRRRIDWLVASVSLPGLVDAPILSDEFSTIQPTRTTLLLADPESQSPASGVRTLVSPAEIVGALQALACPPASGLPVVEDGREKILAA